MTCDLSIDDFVTSKGVLNSNALRKQNISSKELYLHFYGTKKCRFCDNEAKFISFFKGFSEICTTKECSNELRKQTNLEKYGCEFPTQNKDVKNKISGNSVSYKKEVQEKRKQTNLEKYGYISPFKNNSVQEKIKQTNLEKYGCEYQLQRKEVHIQSKETKLKKYKDPNFNNPSKTKQTNLEKYGVEHLTQLNQKNMELFNKEYLMDNFLIQGKLDFYSIVYFFNISESFCRKELKKLNIHNDFVLSKSSIETKINDIFGKIFNRGDRTLIKPLEIDLLNEEHKFGIEYDGLMWHSIGMSEHSMFNNYLEENSIKLKHLNKTDLMEDKGYQLFHIFENEWLDKNKKSIWISIIKDKLNKNKKIGARKCIIKEVPTKEARKFIDENHLQGYTNASIKIGLYYKDELLSIMTFGKSRYNKNIEYELIRFCTKREYTVQGGGSRLLKYFETQYKPKSLISYANRRWSKGNFYEKTGFEFKHITKPNYFYFEVSKNSLYSRNAFQKHKLQNLLESFDPNITEAENMYNNKYRRIYDSGNIVYTKEYKI